MGLRGRLEGSESPAASSPRSSSAELASAPPPLVALQQWQAKQPVVAMHWLHGGVLAVATDLGPHTHLHFYDVSGGCTHLLKSVDCCAGADPSYERQHFGFNMLVVHSLVALLSDHRQTIVRALSEPCQRHVSCCCRRGEGNGGHRGFPGLPPAHLQQQRCLGVLDPLLLGNQCWKNGGPSLLRCIRCYCHHPFPQFMRPMQA